MDTFDPKPRLTKEHGQPFKMKMEPTQFNNNGNTLGSPWKFAPGGKSGLPVSDLFPYVRQCADDFCVIRSMTSNFSEHPGANYFLHTGNGQQGRPSMGSWFSYGLGADSQNLPAYVVLNGGLIPPGGVDNFYTDSSPPPTRPPSSAPPTTQSPTSSPPTRPGSSSRTSSPSPRHSMVS